MTIKEYMMIRNLYKMHEGDDKKIVNSLLEMNKELKLIDATKIVLKYLQDLNDSPNNLVQRFRHGGIEYGLIPDFEEIKTKEYLDIDKYEADEDNIHRLMAVLYRPVVKSSVDKYDIEEYNGTSAYCDQMLHVNINIYHSVIAFFLTLNHVLLKDFQTSIQKKNRKRLKKSN